MSSPTAIPLVATYRVQLGPGFGFDEAAGVVEYLAALGVSHLYSSPALEAAPGSTHGYDVVDPTRPREELGGPAAHDRLVSALRARGLGQVLDIVPNHMAIRPENPWWWDVLENGPSSRYASYFDVEWAPPEERLRDRVLLPVLGDHIGRVIERGEIHLVRDGGSFELRYFEHRVPVAPRSLVGLLGRAAARADSDELAFLADATEQLPLPTATDRDSIERRHRDKEVLRRQLLRLCTESPRVAAALDEEVAALAADPDAMDAFLAQQNCRLAYWRAAARDLGYRRFFDVSSLVGLRVEEPRVFEATHALISRWLAEGVIDGVRVDHPDGLKDPEAYLRRLREARPDAWVVVEKILDPDERLPATWPVDGTTGYEFLNLVTGVLVNPAGEVPLTELYRSFTERTEDVPALRTAGKHLVMRELLGSDVNRLTALFLMVCERHRRFRDFSRHELHEVLKETLAAFPVYRAYVSVRGASRDDELVVTEAIEVARRRRQDLDPELFEFLQNLLLLRVPGELEAELAFRFQQLSSAVMAKGVEDTAFYNHHRLLALSEVGGDPGKFGASVEEFHRRCEENRRRWPRAMLATSTHDTKRSEDVRARLAVLSELPQAFARLVSRLSELAAPHRSGAWPDRNTEYLYFQTLVGAWPLGVDRARAYMEKAIREAKANTSWTTPVPDFEAAVSRLVEGTLADPAFVDELARFVAQVAPAGFRNSLTQTLLKLTAPGVPDLYQGCELWDLSLVDPDNRRAVDFAARRELLGSLEGLSPEQVMERVDSGLPKLFVITRALAVRRRWPEVFQRGPHRAVAAVGAKADHLVAFTRGEEALVVAPRWPVGLAQGWGGTTLPLPAGRWRNVFTGERWDGGESVELERLLFRFPVLLATVEARE